MTTQVPIQISDIDPRPPCADPERERRLAILEQWMTPHRLARVENTLRNRVTQIAVVVDGIYDLGNAAAIMRTCDGLGVHRVYLIDSCTGSLPPKRTSQGAHKWLEINRYPQPQPCIEELREQGYLIAGAALSDHSTPLEELDVSRPIAIAVGNERDGLSKTVLDACDVHFHIPMYGFSQSFNVSVAATIALHDLLRRYDDLRPSKKWRGDMSPEALDVLRDDFYFKAVNNAEAILARELGE